MPSGGEILIDRVHDAYKYGEHFDCKIICGSLEFDVHKVIISGHSEYFKIALKRDTFKEGEEGVIRLKARPSAVEDESSVDYLACDDPEMVKHMISYFYSYMYTCGNTNANTTDDANESDDSATFGPQAEILTHAKVFAIAVKYQVDGLREYAAKCFRYAVHVAWDSEAFLQAVTVVLKSTPEEVRELREIVFDTIYDHYGDLRHTDEVEDAFQNHPLFARDLLDRKWDRQLYYTQTGTAESQCAVCHRYKDESELASGLPKTCRQCDSGDWSGW